MKFVRNITFSVAILIAFSCSHKIAKVPPAPGTALTARTADHDREEEAEAENRARPRFFSASADIDRDDPDRGDDPDADNAGEAAAFFVMQRWQGPGDLPMQRYLKAKADSHRLPAIALGARSGARSGGRISTEASGTFGTWESLGPGNVGGRIRGIAIDPGNPDTVYSAAASGGIWKTTDGGKTWKPMSDFLPVLTIGSMVMDPSNASTLYVGTGESGHNFTALRGIGIFKTSDGGQTWNQLTATNNSNFYYVNALAINPKQPSHIFAGTNTGLYYSSDGGDTWKAQTLKSGTTYSCTSLAVRSDQPTDYLFAACGTPVNGVNTVTVFRNKDVSGDVSGTGTWEAVLTDPAMSSTAIHIAPSAQDTIYALATTNDSKSPFRSALLGVYRSTQAGDVNTWTKQADASDPNSVAANILSYPQCTYSPTDHHGQGGYNLEVAVDPRNPNTVFALGLDVFRSDDGGVTWGWTNMYSTGVASTTGHADQHAIAFDPGWDGQANQTLWIGNDGGMWRTTTALGAVAGAMCSSNARSIGVKWIDENNGFPVTQFYHGTVLPGGASYYGGTQDNGTPIGSDAVGPNFWGYLYGGDGGHVAVDPVDPNVMFYEYVNLALRKTVDGGASNYSAIKGITETPGNFLFINYFAQDPADPLKMYTGATQLWRSIDEAETWTAASAPIAKINGANDVISAITVDPANPNHLLFGTASAGRIYSVPNALTSDENSVFQFTSPRSGYVSQIVFDPANAGRVYVAYRTFRSSPASDSQIYRSDDGGKTWAALGVNGSGPLPDVPVDTILLDPDDPNRLYAGTDTGLIASFDGGVTWTRDTNPFADALVETLVIQYQGGNKMLYAFTHGRGVWRVNLNDVPAPACAYSLSSPAVTLTAHEQTASIDIATDPSCAWTAQPGQSFVNIQSPAGGQGPGTIYFSVGYNNGKARTDTFYVQNQSVDVTQSADDTGSHSGSNDTLAKARVIDQLPYGDISNNINATSDGTDPVHSCTNSADTRTQWWSYTPAVSGQVIATITAEAYQFAGNAGTVITAYPLESGKLGGELACGTLPEQRNAAWKSVSIRFPVTAGATYIIEAGSTNNNTAYEILDVLPVPSITLAPENPTLPAGGQQQFSASVLGVPNTAVRWILAPTLGSLDNKGMYTAPLLIDSPVTVTITARSFANANASASSTVTIQPPPISFSTAGVANAASFQGGAISPGEMVTIFGTSLGPTSPTPSRSTQLENSSSPTSAIRR